MIMHFRAFALVELRIVVAVIGVLAALVGMWILHRAESGVHGGWCCETPATWHRILGLFRR